MPCLLLSIFLPLKLLFLLPRPLKGLTRLVTQVMGWKWPRARRLAKVELSQRRRAKARKLLLSQRSLSRSSPKPQLRRRRPPRARLLMLPPPS